MRHVIHLIQIDADEIEAGNKSVFRGVAQLVLLSFRYPTNLPRPAVTGLFSCDFRPGRETAYARQHII